MTSTLKWRFPSQLLEVVTRTRLQPRGAASPPPPPPPPRDLPHAPHHVPHDTVSEGVPPPPPPPPSAAAAAAAAAAEEDSDGSWAESSDESVTEPSPATGGPFIGLSHGGARAGAAPGKGWGTGGFEDDYDEFVDSAAAGWAAPVAGAPVPAADPAPVPFSRRRARAAAAAAAAEDHGVDGGVGDGEDVIFVGVRGAQRERRAARAAAAEAEVGRMARAAAVTAAEEKQFCGLCGRPKLAQSSAQSSHPPVAAAQTGVCECGKPRGGGGPAGPAASSGRRVAAKPARAEVPSPPRDKSVRPSISPCSPCSPCPSMLTNLLARV